MDSPSTIYAVGMDQLRSTLRNVEDKETLARRRMSQVTSIQTKFPEESPLFPIVTPPPFSALELDWHQSPQRSDSPVKLDLNFTQKLDSPRIHYHNDMLTELLNGMESPAIMGHGIMSGNILAPTNLANLPQKEIDQTTDSDFKYQPEFNYTHPRADAVPVPNVYGFQEPLLTCMPQKGDARRLPDGSIAQLPSHLEPGDTVVLMPESHSHQIPMQDANGNLVINWTAPDGKSYIVRASPQGFATTTGGTLDIPILPQMTQTSTMPSHPSRSTSPNSSEAAGPARKKHETGTHTASGKVKPFACHICPQTFSRSHDLKRHLCKHTGIRPFACDACGKSFSRRDGLTRHLEGNQCPGKTTGSIRTKRGKRREDSESE
jgi:hypothetical protein